MNNPKIIKILHYIKLGVIWAVSTELTRCVLHWLRGIATAIVLAAGVASASAFTVEIDEAALAKDRHKTLSFAAEEIRQCGERVPEKAGPLLPPVG